MDGEGILPCCVRKFTPVKHFEAGVKPPPQATGFTTVGSNYSLSPYGQETCCLCAHRGTESEQGDENSGTTVIEVTTVTKTTRRSVRMSRAPRKWTLVPFTSIGTGFVVGASTRLRKTLLSIVTQNLDTMGSERNSHSLPLEF
jgi:hypothetical protein